MNFESSVIFKFKCKILKHIGFWIKFGYSGFEYSNSKSDSNESAPTNKNMTDNKLNPSQNVFCTK